MGSVVHGLIKQIPLFTCTIIASLILTLQKHIEKKLERVRQLEEEAMCLARAMQPLLEASARKKEQQDTPNGLHNPISARRRCGEDDPVNVRVMMVNSSTEAVVSELQAIDSISQSNGLEERDGTHSKSQNST